MKTGPKMEANGTITAALAILRAEYLSQLGELAEKLRPGFEAGLYGAEIDLKGSDGENPHSRLIAAVEASLGKDENLARAVVCGSPNHVQSFNHEAQPGNWRQAASDVIVADLCILAESSGWTKWKTKGFLPSFLPRVPVVLPRRAA
jgi:hypothetical protein